MLWFLSERGPKKTIRLERMTYFKTADVWALRGGVNVPLLASTSKGLTSLGQWNYVYNTAAVDLVTWRALAVSNQTAISNVELPFFSFHPRNIWELFKGLSI
jgi:hypothetical protein